jgi:hypothetical protein
MWRFGTIREWPGVTGKPSYMALEWALAGMILVVAELQKELWFNFLW